MFNETICDSFILQISNHSILQIILKKIHLSMDYGLILTWSVSLRNHEFSCDAIIVYKESNSNETLVDSPTVSMILFRSFKISGHMF